MINIVSSVCSILFRYLFTKTHPVQFLPNNLVLMYLVRKCWNYVGKEYRIFNLGFAIFTSYLLIDELKLYFIYKPTFTSIVQTKLKPGHFPNILSVPTPPMTWRNSSPSATTTAMTTPRDSQRREILLVGEGTIPRTTLLLSLIISLSSEHCKIVLKSRPSLNKMESW